ncbi:hypothetical protein DFH11DRAFT_1882544 [Phellopilus nigrolimitatus]|nr:hypothetical protein DFH11DRAFT_1882544 [Phellopilus nigrolimitatus]
MTTFYDYVDIKRDEYFHKKYLRVDPSKVDSSDAFNTFYSENIERMTAVLAKSLVGKDEEAHVTSVVASSADETFVSSLLELGDQPTRTSMGSVGSHRTFDSISSAAGPPENALETATGQYKFSPVLEQDLYQPLMKILARVSIHVARKINISDDGRCILFQSGHLHPMYDGTEDMRKDNVKKPDLVAVWKPLSDGEALVSDATTGAPTSHSWKMTQIVSFLEVKLEDPALPDRVGAYASVLPRGRPDIAGLLLMTCTAEFFRFCWSDASRFVYSKRYEWKRDVHLLFYFLHTLYCAVDDLPHLDSTIQLSKEENEKLTWIVKTANSELEAVRLFSTLAWEKQTWILQSGSSIIKDLWRNKKSRFTEGAVLEKIHKRGFVPGVVRLRSYEELAVTKSDGSPLKLETSKKHSKVIYRGNSILGYTDVEDPDPDEEDVSNSETKRIGYEVITHDIKDVDSTMESAQPHQEEIECMEAVGDDSAEDAPDYDEPAMEDDNADKVYEKKIRQRVKTRAILDSYGDALEECTSLLQLLKIGFDIVHTHQFCVMNRKSLHRDISKSNIIINPKHNKHPEEKQNSDVGKYIEQVLDPSLKDVKEIVMLIDWDNAALLDANPAAPVTDRAGTPMYIARAVSVGAFYFSGPHTRAKFPLISKEARALYIGAYDQEKYDYYIRGDDKPTAQYDEFMETMESHDPGEPGHDSRSLFILETSVNDWKTRLHPKLRLVARMLHRMAEYLKVQWAYWKKFIPDDHAHEMMVRLFLDEIVHVQKQGDVTINLKRARRFSNPGNVIRSPLKSSKRSRLNDGTAQETVPGLPKASVHSLREAITGTCESESGADVFGFNQSNDNVGPVGGNVPQAQSRSSVGEKRRREDGDVE